MFNAINKTAAILLVGLAMASCADKAKEGAMELYKQSENAIEQREYKAALVYLDTLNNRYPQQTEIRRGGLRLRAMAMQGIATDSIAVADAALAQATALVEELRPKFKHIEGAASLEGYFIPSDTKSNVMAGNAVQGRVSEKGFFYLVVNIQGRSIGFTGIRFASGNQSVESQPISHARVIKVEGSESAVFSPEELQDVGPWLAEHTGALTATLIGTKSNVSIKLTAAQAASLALCSKYATALQAQRLASIHREKYERMLATARDQIANNEPLSQE